MNVLSALSREYVRYWVKSRVAGVDYDPTGDTVQFSFPLAGTTPTSWASGVWETVDDSYFALCLIGPSTPNALTAGEYDVYIKITDSPEIPVRKVDRLKIT